MTAIQECSCETQWLNLVAHAEVRCNSSRDQLCNFLAGILEIDIEEVALFAPDETLTASTRRAKWDLICRLIRNEQIDPYSFSDAERDYFTNTLYEEDLA